jgi:hypothetical protein
MCPTILSLHDSPHAPLRRTISTSNSQHSKDSLVRPRLVSSSNNINNLTNNLNPTTATDNGPAMATATRRRLTRHTVTQSSNRQATTRTRLLARRLVRLLPLVAALHPTTRSNFLRCIPSRRKLSVCPCTGRAREALRTQQAKAELLSLAATPSPLAFRNSTSMEGKVG